MNQTAHIVTLLNKYRQNDISAHELQELQQWAALHPTYRKLLEDFSPDRPIPSGPEWADYMASGRSMSFPDLLDRIASQKSKTLKRRIAWLSAAASIVVIGFCSLYFSNKYTASYNEPVAEVVPGSKKAILLTDNGHKQEIADERGLLVTDEGMFYSDGQAVAENILLETQHLNLVVPKGGEYQITLSDGTRVWLNSNSTLKFPPEFATDQRTVEISGEAFFEVARDAKRPFIVQSNYQEITVLGTAFNVKAYSDDELNTTTLVEGSVQVRDRTGNDRFKLQPGQAAIAGKENQLKIGSGDVQQATSWKQGEFNFNRTPFEEVAKQIARWYDLEVEYRNKIPQEYFTGQLSRSVDFEIVAEFLKVSGVNLELVSNKLIIH